MGSKDARKRMNVLFSGRVQGVGFRYTTCRKAEDFKVEGFVRNLPDGNVELVAEGPEQDLVDFLHAVQASQVGRQIADTRVGWAAATNQFDRFGVAP